MYVHMTKIGKILKISAPVTNLNQVGYIQFCGLAHSATQPYKRGATGECYTPNVVIDSKAEYNVLEMNEYSNFYQ